MGKLRLIIPIISMIVFLSQMACANTKKEIVEDQNMLIDNNTVWKDTNGDPIVAQGGCIVKVGDTYNWIGPEINRRSGFGFHSFNRYTSIDLKNWEKQNPIIKPDMDNIPFSKDSWVARPWIFHHEETSSFVMYCEWNDGKDEIRNNQIAVLTASDISGPWICDTIYYRLPDSEGNTFPMGDIGGFQDDDGNAYILYTFDKGGANRSQSIVKLDPVDYKRVMSYSEGGYVAEFSDSEREAASIIKRNGVYYYFTSACLGWAPSKTKYRTAQSMTGIWSEEKDVITDPENSMSFQTQHDFVLPIVGSEQTTFLYCGDRWSVCHPNNYDGTVGLYAWYPLEFSEQGVPIIRAENYEKNGGDWFLNIQTGEWDIVPLKNEE